MSALVAASGLVAVSADALKNLTTAGAFVPIVIALVIVKFAVNAVVRTVVLLVALALGVLIYTQRSEIQSCVDNADTTQLAVKCKIAGFSVDLDLPSPG